MSKLREQYWFGCVISVKWVYIAMYTFFVFHKSILLSFIQYDQSG